MASVAMSVFRRHLVIQFPSWVLAAIILYGLSRWAGLPPAAGVVLWIAYLAKDLLLYRFLRSAYEPGPSPGPERLVGLQGRAESDSYVRVHGELWKASPVNDSPSLKAGDSVLVEAAHGMRLMVRVRDQGGRKPQVKDGERV